MAFTIIARRAEEIPGGAGFVPSRLGELLSQQRADLASTSEKCQVEVYFLNAFRDRLEFNGYRKRFGRDIIQFFFLNDCAVAACKHFNIEITPLGTIDQLPQAAGAALKHLFATVAPASAVSGMGANDGESDTGPLAAAS